MLEARNISLEVDGDEGPLFLLNNVNFCIPTGHFVAIVGPSGCGKTTLLKAIAGIKETTGGSFMWCKRNLAVDGDFEVGEVGYVPQFSIAYDELTVDESVEEAARLRTMVEGEELDELIDGVLQETGLDEIADRPVKLLSGGQRRRLALAMELVSHPHILLCDEVTSGLDPQSEQEIVELLHRLSLKEGRIVISVTHSLSQAELYDSIMVMNGGCLAYHGCAEVMPHYFGVEHLTDVYARLTLREPEEWHASWMKHRVEYYGDLEVRHVDKFRSLGLPPPSIKKVEEGEEPELPSMLSQMMTLLRRRFAIFFRDRGQLMLQVAMIVIFPIMVALFSEKGRDELWHLEDKVDKDLMAEVQTQHRHAEVRARVGSAVSGIIMFQVILLGLMGSNNAAREVAAERDILEKEKFAGLSPGAYVGARLIFLTLLVLVQSLWMFAFVEYCWPMRGDALNHLLFLVLANASMTSVCLGISANCKGAAQASLLCIYLVGFQLPLSGAVLALPQSIEQFVQPFISAYWAWSGSIQGGLDSEVFKAVNGIVQTSFTMSHICLSVLVLHVVAGVVLAYIGVRRTFWE